MENNNSCHLVLAKCQALPVSSFYPHISQLLSLLYGLFYKCGTERLSSLPKITQLDQSQMGFKSRQSGSRVCSLVLPLKIRIQVQHLSYVVVKQLPMKNRAAMTEINSSNILIIRRIFIQEWLGENKDSHAYSLKGSCPLLPYVKGVK